MHRLDGSEETSERYADDPNPPGIEVRKASREGQGIAQCFAPSLKADFGHFGGIGAVARIEIVRCQNGKAGIGQLAGKLGEIRPIKTQAAAPVASRIAGLGPGLAGRTTSIATRRPLLSK